MNSFYKPSELEVKRTMDFSALRGDPEKKILTKGELIQRIFTVAKDIKDTTVVKARFMARTCSCCNPSSLQSMHGMNASELWLISALDNRLIALTEHARSLAMALEEMKNG